MGYTRVPTYAKIAAAQGLDKRKRLEGYKKFGLTREQARKQGIASGVERARQIIRQQTISQDTAKRIARFYNRFKGCKTKKCEGALNLWGGRRWGRELSRKLY